MRSILILQLQHNLHRPKITDDVEDMFQWLTLADFTTTDAAITFSGKIAELKDSDPQVPVV
ncbi:hypothetical protein Bca52824_094892 [Brassica carinata]|uniref:Uncharacterized protein n=1 Tax=Brassica carinata TaxID=52824 RepID=A0A8X7TIP9_BRACI|nr:hypothetical protein Bca52824_094892 [Brassica carinata]